jgi:hypothetical protein
MCPLLSGIILMGLVKASQGKAERVKSLHANSTTELATLRTPGGM